MLKSSLKLTRPKTVRSYTKQVKTVNPTTLPLNPLSGPNHRNLVVKSSSDNVSNVSSEANNNSASSFSTSNSKIGSCEAVVQLDSLSISASAVSTTQVTVEPFQRPNTRSQLLVITAFTEDQKSFGVLEDAISTTTPKSAKSALSSKFSKQWEESMSREAKSLFEHNVFEKAVNIPSGTKIIPSMFTFKVKGDSILPHQHDFCQTY